MKKQECKHTKKYGKSVGEFPNDKIQRICLDCDKVIDEITPVSSGSVLWKKKK